MSGLLQLYLKGYTENPVMWKEFKNSIKNKFRKTLKVYFSLRKDK